MAERTVVLKERGQVPGIIASRQKGGRVTISAKKYIDALAIIGNSHEMAGFVFEGIILPVEDILGASKGNQEIENEMKEYLRLEIESYRKNGRFMFIEEMEEK
ncbi:MAG: hypothetical protein ABIH83_03665 [Candidatus Micrarchaeota archaeon]